MLRDRLRRRLAFRAQLERLEPRWLMTGTPITGAPIDETPAEVFVLAEAAVEPGPTISLPGNGSMTNPVYGSTFRSALSGGVGFWDDPASWSAGRAPTATDNVIIEDGDTLIVRNTSAIAQNIGVYEGGKLQFATDVSTELRVITLVVLGELEMGTAANPIAADVSARLVIRNVAINATTDPAAWGNGLVVLGKARIHGAVKEISDNRLAVEPRAGDTTLTFDRPVTGWRAGDKLYLPGTRQLTDFEYNTGVSMEWENLTIASVAGNVVTLTTALTRNHLGGRNAAGQLEFKPVVQNLTRNAIIRSESATGTRGHTLFAGRADVDIRYAQFSGLGRSQIGQQSNFRLPVHFYHLIGPATPQANGYQYTFVGNAITCPLDPMPFKWGLAINNSHFGLIQNNDLNNWAGAGLVTITGAETQNVIEGNRVMRISGTGERVDDTGEAGVGFWLRGPDNYVRNNLAANIKGGIYSYGFNASHARFLGTVNIPSFQGADPTVAGQATSVNMNFRPFREFRGNEVFAAQNGMTYWWMGIHFETPGDVDTQINDFKVWNIYNWGMFLYESNRLTIDGYRFLGGSGRTAITFTDYMTRRFVLQNSRIEHGDVRLPLHTDVRGTAASDQTVGRVVIKDTQFIDGSIWGTPQASVNGSGDLAKRVALLINVQFDNSSRVLSLNDDPNPVNGTPNFNLENYAVIQNYDSAPGASGEDFIVQAIYRTGTGTQLPNRPEITGKIYSLLADTTRPVLSGVAASGITGTSAVIAGNANENSAFQVVYGTSTSYGSYQTHAGFGASRSFTLAGLLPGTTYHYKLIAWDPYGNLVETADQTFTAAGADAVAPTISGVAASGITALAAAIAWTTNEAADTQVEYGTTTSYGSTSPLNTSLLTLHTANLTGLTAGTTYHYRVKSRDAAGNLAVSGDFTFTTVLADVTAPILSGIGSSNVSAGGATVAWTTNEASDTQVEYGTTTGYGSSSTLNTSQVTSHSVNLTGLAANTTYHYRVKSRDAAGNLAVSGDFTFTTAASSPVYSYQNPRPLAPSNPATTVNVSTVSQLINAINNLQSGQTISIAAGTYNLAGVTDGLYVPQGISNWTIRGATGNRADVIINGAGMNGSVRFGFWLSNTSGGTIADLTIRNIREHGIIMNPGVHDFLCHNVEMIDVGDQFLKSNPVSFGNGNDNGVVEYCVFRYTTNEAGAGSTANYSQGVDVHGGDNWVIRYNKFQNIFAPPGGGISGMAAILMWNGSQNTVVEGNVFVNNARDIILGLMDKAEGNDHSGGVIRNNVIYRPSSSRGAEWDVPISIADSPNTKVYHNSVLTSGSWASAIEYRFAATTGTDIRNNLLDAGIAQRDGASGLVANNVTNAAASWFVAPASGDLHLVPSATAAIDKGVSLAGETYDIDGLARPSGSAPDIGADEFNNVAGDTTAPVISGVGTSNLSASGVTIGWTTDEAADTQVEYGTTTSYGSSTALNTTLSTSHTVNLTALAANTTYHFRVKSRDAAGNLRTSGDFTFTTAAAPDTTAPTISNVASSGIGSNAAVISWLTNEAADTQVQYGLTTSYGSTTTLNTSLVTSHTVNLSGLAANTTYHYRVRSRDAAGNLRTSGDFTFTTTAASTVTDWGTIHFARHNNQVLTGGEAWYELTTSRAGELTVEALFAHSGGNIDLALFDEGNQLLVASSSTTDNERVQVTAPAAGTTYLLRVTGANSDVDFRLANMVRKGGTIVEVAGTAGDDTVTFIHAARLWVVVNGVAYDYAPGSVTAWDVDGGSGADQFEARLGAGNDDATFHVQSLDIVNSGYQIHVSGVETALVNGRGGLDKAWLHDSAGNDTLVARPTTVSLEGAGYKNTADGFEKTFTMAQLGGLDVATLFDSTGKDIFKAGSLHASLAGPGFFNWVQSFDEVYARATAGGWDRASLQGTAGDEVLESGFNVRTFAGAGFRLVADKFEKVSVYSGGGDDRAEFYSMRTGNKFSGIDSKATVKVGKRVTWINNFSRVNAYALDGQRPTVDVESLDYLFTKFGSWKAV